MLADQIPSIQEALAEARLDGWLFRCFQQSDPISRHLLGLGEELITRRCYYLIPQSGEPQKLAHGLEPEMLERLPGATHLYTTWQEHEKALSSLVSGIDRLAVQYSPKAVLPAVSRLDLGTAEILRAAGCELVSSGDLIQRFAATWSPEQLESHRRASAHLHEIVQEAFDQVRKALADRRRIDEYQVQQFIVDSFGARGMTTDAVPIVAVDGHSADPHYQPGPEGSLPIEPGNFLLIDLWAREKAPGSIYADICWTGVCAAAPTDRQAEIFEVVARSRDAGLELVRSRYPEDDVRGFEVDDACRKVIREAGYGDQFFHRTGHSIDVSDHGQGANLDNLETHDTRLLAPMTGFSIEPGIYFPGEFGIRSEINVALTLEGVEVTGGVPQQELVRLMG